MFKLLLIFMLLINICYTDERAYTKCFNECFDECMEVGTKDGTPEYFSSALSLLKTCEMCLDNPECIIARNTP